MSGRQRLPLHLVGLHPEEPLPERLDRCAFLAPSPRGDCYVAVWRPPPGPGFERCAGSGFARIEAVAFASGRAAPLLRQRGGEPGWVRLPEPVGLWPHRFRRESVVPSAGVLARVRAGWLAAVQGQPPRPARRELLALDTETTGRVPTSARLVEVALGGDSGCPWSSTVRQTEPIPAEATSLHGIRTEDTLASPGLDEVLRAVDTFAVEADAFVAHNAEYDATVLRSEARRVGFVPSSPRPVLCTYELVLAIFPGWKKHTLGAACAELGVTLEGAHRAGNDALAALRVLRALERGGLDVSRVGEAAWWGAP